MKGGVTSHNNTSQENWPWWSRCETLHHITMHHKRIDLDEGRCVTLHHITIHHNRIIDLDEGRCLTLHHITIHHKRIDLDEGRCETLHHITIHHKRIDLDEGRCETLHHITITLHHKRIDLHECCMGLVLRRKPEHEPCVFPCKVAAANGTSCVRRVRFGLVWIVSRSIGSSSVFCNEWLFLSA